MAVKLKFNNPTVGAVTLKIYRGDAPLDRKALANPIQTIENPATGPLEWVDVTVVQDKVYYYVFETIGPKDRDISQNIRIQASKDRGPGNSVMQIGSYKLGYFDTVVIESIIGVADLIAMTGLSLTSLAPTYLLKMIRNGETFFVPNKPVAVGGVTWNGLNTAGVIDGTKKFRSGGRDYGIYLPHGLSDNDTIDLTGKTFPMDADAVYPNTHSEFTDLIYPVYLYTPPLQSLPNLMNQSITELALTPATRRILCRDVNSADDTVVVRGSSNANRTGVTTVNVASKTNTASNNMLWWPIIKLLETN